MSEQIGPRSDTFEELLERVLRENAETLELLGDYDRPIPGEAVYDRDVGFLYLGDQGVVDDSPEGHMLEYDDDDNLIGITLVYPEMQLAREGVLAVTLPNGRRVELPTSLLFAPEPD